MHQSFFHQNTSVREKRKYQIKSTMYFLTFNFEKENKVYITNLKRGLFQTNEDGHIISNGNTYTKVGKKKRGVIVTFEHFTLKIQYIGLERFLKQIKYQRIKISAPKCSIKNGHL